MNPTHAQILTGLFKQNHQMLRSLVEGITQEDSLRQLPFEGNCLNWVVGHVLDTCYNCQDWLGMPSADAELYAGTYGYGSPPMTDPAKACNLEDMLKRLDAAHLLIAAQLECLPPVELESPIALWYGTVTKTEALYFMLWHMTYHTGQLEQLSQLAAANH